MFTVSSLLALVALPAVQAHIGLWHPSMFGFSESYTPVTPLANKGFGEWWFHGNLGDAPSESMSITPGSSLTVQLACDKSYTDWGNNPSSDACPRDSGAYHAGGTTGSQSGWSGNDESNLQGCALAIAFKADANQVQPEDFIVMSVQERCVRQRDTSFEIPSNLPACPEGGCTCAWFWAGKNSALEMYMTGFKCNVEGGVATSSYPKPAPPRRNSVSGPTQPFYWANDMSNLDYTPEWANKPSYNSAFGYTNGAQTGAFAGLGSGGGATTTGTTTRATTTGGAEETSTGDWEETSTRRTRTRTRTRSSTASPTDWQNLVAVSSTTTTAGSGPTGTKACKRNVRRSRHNQRAIRSGH